MGALFVALASILWATDALFRYPLVQHQIEPAFIVFSEHLFGSAVLLAWALAKYKKNLFQATVSQWLSLAVVGGGSSALATVLFVTSFKFVNPSVSILVQKLQPILVVGLAAFFLGERPKTRFYFWAAIAFYAGMLISFPTLDFDFTSEEGSLVSRGSLYAISAAAIWAMGTVLGKKLLRDLEPGVVTTWRFVFGLVFLGAFLAVQSDPIPWQVYRDFEALRALLYMSLVTGVISMILYYQGMVRIRASTVTFVELVFPISAVAINTVFLGLPLMPRQLFAAVVLLFAVTRISVANRAESQ